LIERIVERVGAEQVLKMLKALANAKLVCFGSKIVTLLF
jgi:hypothetical protein